MSAPNLPSHESGFSLVELMVSVVLGLLLLAGAVATYLASSRSYQEVEQVSALAENAHYAEQLISDALLHVGFFGEAPPEEITPASGFSTSVAGDCAAPASALDARNFLFAGVISGTTIGCIADGRAGTGFLVVKRVRPEPQADGPRVGAQLSNPLHVNGEFEPPLDNDTVYVASNPLAGQMFRGNNPVDVGPSGEVAGGTAWPYEFEVFYVRDTDPGSEDDPPILARMTLSTDISGLAIETQDLVEGVEDIRMSFGIDSDNDAEVDSFVTAAQVTAGNNWDSVLSVELFLVVRSLTQDPAYTDSKVYVLPGGNYTPATNADLDNFRRLITSVLVSLRNRVYEIRG